MSAHYEMTETIKATPDRVFQVIDDLPLTSSWLPPCLSLEKVGAGPNAVGDKLRYVYQQGGHKGEMEGVIVDRVPGSRLVCRYFDNSFEVIVDLKVAPAPDGQCLSTHKITIKPKGFLGTMMTPMINLALGKQTRDAATNLKKLIESNQ